MAVFELPPEPMVRTWLFFKRPVRAGDRVVRTTKMGGKSVKATQTVTNVLDRYDPVHGGTIVAGPWWITHRMAAEGKLDVVYGTRLQYKYKFQKG